MKGNLYKVLLLDTVHPIMLELLDKAQICYEENYHSKYEEVEKLIHKYEGIILRSRIPLDARMLEAGKKLKFVARVGAGMENIDTLAAKRLGIVCLNSPEGNRDAVAEHALGMLLALANNFLKADSEVRKGIWKREENRGFEICGKTIGIIGCGNMGYAFAQRLSGLKARVIAYDKYKTGFSDQFAQEVSLNEIFKEADIISLHVPLTEETKYMIDEDFLKQCRKNIILINTARGKVVKTHDLVIGLKSGKVLGAAIDVLEYENSSFETLDLKEDFNFLKQQWNVIFTPHIAGWSVESNIKLSQFLAEKIIAVLK